nr:uncharacterized protein LOC105480746 [Macaca nemestrina]
MWEKTFTAVWPVPDLSYRRPQNQSRPSRAAFGPCSSCWPHNGEAVCKVARKECGLGICYKWPGVAGEPSVPSWSQSALTLWHPPQHTQWPAVWKADPSLCREAPWSRRPAQQPQPPTPDCEDIGSRRALSLKLPFCNHSFAVDLSTLVTCCVKRSPGRFSSQELSLPLKAGKQDGYTCIIHIKYQAQEQPKLEAD